MHIRRALIKKEKHVTKDVAKKEYDKKWYRSFRKADRSGLTANSPHKIREGIQRFTKNKPFYQLLTELSCQITLTIQKACILPTAHLRVLFDSQSKLR
jgi:hypothetical protein